MQIELLNGIIIIIYIVEMVIGTDGHDPFENIN